MSKRHGLESPFPSSPHRPPKFTVQVTKGQTQVIETFTALYAARHFIEAIIDERNTSWKDSRTLVVPGEPPIPDTFIREERMEDILEHKLTPDEHAWELPEPYLSRARYLATGIREVKTSPHTTHKEQHDEEVEETSEAPDKRKSGAKRTGPAPRPDRAGLTSIGDICTTLKIEPRIARGILRSTDTPKPDVGWAWPAAEAKKIQALIAKELK